MNGRNFDCSESKTICDLWKFILKVGSLSCIMSSHHFVKEDQEPALIIANGQACKNELLFSLLEWNPYVVVLDGAVERVLSLGIKFDALLGDFDRLGSDPEIFTAQPGVEIVHTPDQNKTDLEKAIEFLIQKNHKGVNIVWSTGYRMDHTFNNIISLGKYPSRIHTVILDDFSKIFVLPKTYKKYYQKGQVISLFPIGKVDGIHTSGLLYNLSDESLELPGRTGSSNEATENGIVEISYRSGILLMMECSD